MRFVLLLPILLCASVSFGAETHPACELAKESIVGRSAAGVAQASNMGGIRIKCFVPARPFPTELGSETRPGLKAETSVYEILADGSKKLVPSEVYVFAGGGAGFGPNPEPEWGEFYVHIPLDSEELDAEVRRYVAKLAESMTPEQRAQYTEEMQKRGMENLRQLVYQHRAGHYQINCRVLDGSRVMGSDRLELEVLYKGRFSDVGLAGSPPF